MDIVSSCINCLPPGSLLATLTVIMIGVVFVVRAEMRKSKSELGGQPWLIRTK